MSVMPRTAVSLLPTIAPFWALTSFRGAPQHRHRKQSPGLVWISGTPLTRVAAVSAHHSRPQTDAIRERPWRLSATPDPAHRSAVQGRGRRTVW